MGAKIDSPPPASKWSFRIAVIGVIWALYTMANKVNSRFFLMSPEGLKDVFDATLETAYAAGQNENATFIVSTLMDGLVEKYPNVRMQTDFLDRSEWVFNNAGGAMGSMYIIHASMSEYLIIFGTGTGTEGHSGRHTADDHFHILKGTQRAYPAGALEGEVYRQGDVHWMHRGVVKQYMMEPNSWALEYAAGWIPPMLPFGFFDAMFSTLDVVTVWHTVRITGREMIANLLRGKI